MFSIVMYTCDVRMLQTKVLHDLLLTIVSLSSDITTMVSLFMELMHVTSRKTLQTRSIFKDEYRYVCIGQTKLRV